MVNIKRKAIIYTLSFILSIVLLSPILVNAEGSRVFDDGNLYTESETRELEDEANILSNDYHMDIIIVTTNDAEGKSSREYADDFYDYNGFGVGNNLDVILFLIDMDNREAYISTSGKGIKYLTDKRIEDIIERVLDSGLGDGDYYNASKSFLSRTKKYLESGIPSNQYSQDENEKSENKLTLLETIMSLLGSGAVSAGFFFRTRSKYKMKNPVKAVTFRDNSIVSLAAKNDILLDTVLTHRIIPKATSSDSGKSTTHTSSSGKTHGGGGGKF